jgi:hypothetical protein
MLSWTGQPLPIVLILGELLNALGLEIVPRAHSQSTSTAYCESVVSVRWYWVESRIIVWCSFFPNTRWQPGRSLCLSGGGPPSSGNAAVNRVQRAVNSTQYWQV